MDYRFKQGSIAIATAFILMIISVVIIANWRTISNKLGANKHSALSVSTATSEAEVALEVAEEKENLQGVRVGNDLYAWMADEDFFDDGKSVEEIERRIIEEVENVRPIKDDGTGREER